MTNEHITRFEVSNFKKFDRLVVENIGQVNLITGDNNVGKTSLLEVLLLEPNMKQILATLNYVYEGRKIYNDDEKVNFLIGKEVFNRANNLIGLVQNDQEKTINVFQAIKDQAPIGFYIENVIVDVVNNSDRDEFKDFTSKTNLFNYREINPLSKNWLIFHKTNEGFSNPEKQKGRTYDIHYMVDVTSSYYFDFLTSQDYFPFVRIEAFYANDILDYYDEITQSSQTKLHLIEMLNTVFSNDVIEDIVPKAILGRNILCIATKEKDEFHPITYYGDGFVRTVRIVLEILMNKGKRLMIDEIETGLHFSRQKEVWKTIMNVAVENNVQLFCTTHSQDCITAFVEATEEISDMKDKIRLIELEAATGEKTDRNVYASTYNYSQIKTGLNSEVNLRGGDINR